jgi:hypothetical protein
MRPLNRSAKASASPATLKSTRTRNPAPSRRQQKIDGSKRRSSSQIRISAIAPDSSLGRRSISTVRISRSRLFLQTTVYTNRSKQRARPRLGLTNLSHLRPSFSFEKLDGTKRQLSDPFTPNAIGLITGSLRRTLTGPSCVPPEDEPRSFQRLQRVFVARRAPSARASNLAQQIEGWPTRVPIPQSVPASTFSRPTSLA